MCGIVCYKGKKQASDIILDGLEKLEYRGYDSSGIGLMKERGIEVYKEKGGLDNLEKSLEGVDLSSHLGIGHIRWATHGQANKTNSHPHMSNNGKIALVHNGIIENYKDLKEELIKEGYSFKSQTDTEVLAVMLEKYYKGDILEALKIVKGKIRGAYALGIICADEADRLVAIRKDSPLVLGIMDDGFILASDSPSFVKYTKKVIYIDNDQIVDIKGDHYQIYGKDMEKIQGLIQEISYEKEDSSKKSYDHFMLKEIEEQAGVIEKLFSYNVDKNTHRLKKYNYEKNEIENLDNIYIIACGTAYHAGLIGKYIFEKLLRIPVRVELASEFRYSEPLVGENSLVIALSQSGETADTLKALRLAQKLGAKTLAITNVAESSIDRQADKTIYCQAGPEIAVASTKAYTSQLINLYFLLLEFGIHLGKITQEESEQIIRDIESLPGKIEKIIGRKDELRFIAKDIKDYDHLFYLARGIDYYSALEASLKLKEISYIHTEAFAAGELKHGTIALIEDQTPVIAIVTQRNLLEKSLANIEEVLARKASAYIISQIDDPRIKDHGRAFIYEGTSEILAPVLSIISCQLIAYYTSLLKGLNVDKPRNLAKSVTVE